jgi:hypothetical protein
MRFLRIELRAQHTARIYLIDSEFEQQFLRERFVLDGNGNHRNSKKKVILPRQGENQVRFRIFYMTTDFGRREIRQILESSPAGLRGLRLRRPNWPWNAKKPAIAVKRR